MLHQRVILRIYYVLAALAALALSGMIGSFIVGYLLTALISIPVIWAIKKIFPAPDWYANEGESTGMTSMNLSSREP